MAGNFGKGVLKSVSEVVSVVDLDVTFLLGTISASPETMGIHIPVQDSNFAQSHFVTA